MRRRPTVALALAFACAAGAVPGKDDPQRRPDGRGRLPLPSQSPDDLGSGRLLVASRTLSGPIFGETVILLLEHGEAGATGVIVNRPTDAPLSELLPDFEALEQRSDRAWFGGPVGLGSAFLLLIRAERPPEGAREILDGVHISGDPDDLRTLLAIEDSTFRGYLGYAGWGPSQLEGEMARRDWWVMSGDAAMTFTDDPARLWSELIAHCEGVETRRRAAP